MHTGSLKNKHLKRKSVRLCTFHCCTFWDRQQFKPNCYTMSH